MELKRKQIILSSNYTAFSWYSEQINKGLSPDLLQDKIKMVHEYQLRKQLFLKEAFTSCLPRILPCVRGKAVTTEDLLCAGFVGTFTSTSHTPLMKGAL